MNLTEKLAAADDETTEAPAGAPSSTPKKAPASKPRSRRASDRTASDEAWSHSKRQVQQMTFPTLEEAKAARDRIAAGDVTFDELAKERNLAPGDLLSQRPHDADEKLLRSRIIKKLKLAILDVSHSSVVRPFL